MLSSLKRQKIYTAILLLSLLAIIITLNLIYIRFKPVSEGSFCNLNAYWNCDRVNQSTFAEFFGIPVSYLGFLFYIFLTINIVALVKSFNYRKVYPFSANTLFKLSTIATVLGSFYLMTQELSLFFFNSGLQVYSIIKFLFISLLSVFVLIKFQKHSDKLDFVGFLTSLSVLGVSFSWYLTNIELFVLEGICIFCLAQQVVILFILTLFLISLFQEKKQNEKQ